MAKKIPRNETNNSSSVPREGLSLSLLRLVRGLVIFILILVGVTLLASPLIIWAVFDEVYEVTYHVIGGLVFLTAGVVLLKIWKI